MKIKKAGPLALSALIVFGVSDLNAQNEARGQRRGGVRRGAAIESIMSMRDRLELTDEQLSELETLRIESVDRRNADMATMSEMRSRLRAGQIRRSEMMAFMEERSDGFEGVADERRQRLEGVLTEAQRETLQQDRSRRRSMARGRTNGMRGAGRAGGGQGMRGRAGFRGGQGMNRAQGRNGSQQQRIRRRLRRGGQGPGLSGEQDPQGDIQPPTSDPGDPGYPGEPFGGGV